MSSDPERLEVCGVSGGVGIGAGHECLCNGSPHEVDPGDSTTWHGCVCGAIWSGEVEAVFEGRQSRAQVMRFPTSRARDRAQALEIDGVPTPTDAEVRVRFSDGTTRAIRVRTAHGAEALLELLQVLDG